MISDIYLYISINKNGNTRYNKYENNRIQLIFTHRSFYKSIKYQLLAICVQYALPSTMQMGVSGALGYRCVKMFGWRPVAWRAGPRARGAALRRGARARRARAAGRRVAGAAAAPPAPARARHRARGRRLPQLRLLQAEPAPLGDQVIALFSPFPLHVLCEPEPIHQRPCRIIPLLRLPRVLIGKTFELNDLSL